jgi:UDP-N-acetylmuramoyl-tripeptide--D-alanyl-D-alanine ligase
VLGDMLELGASAPELHHQIGALVARRADRLFTYGNLAKEIAQGARDAGLPAGMICVAKSHEELAERLLGVLRAGDRVLIKGSRGMRMEKVTAALRMAKQKTAVNGD